MKHVQWVDYAKVIGIYSVVLGHTALYTPLTNWIYTFSMPLFFFLSGYLFSFERNPSFGPFVSKRFRQLIIPYFSINLITYLFWFFIGRKVGADSGEVISWYEPLWNAVLGNGAKMVHDVPIWFFLCLFVIEILYYLLFCRVKDVFYLWIGIFILTIGGYLNYTFNPYYLPFDISTALVGIVFYALGNRMRTSGKFVPNRYGFVLSFLLMTLVCYMNGRINMHKNYYGNYAWFLSGGLAGIYFIFCLSSYCLSLFKRRRWIEYIAMNTLIICGFHLLTFSFMKGIMIYVFDLPLSLLEQKIGVNFLFAFLSMACCLPLIYVINTYFPFLTGRRERKRKPVTSL